MLLEIGSEILADTQCLTIYQALYLSQHQPTNKKNYITDGIQIFPLLVALRMAKLSRLNVYASLILHYRFCLHAGSGASESTTLICYSG